MVVFRGLGISHLFEKSGQFSHAGNFYLESAYSFDVSNDIRIPFSRVSVTIEPSRSLLTT